MIEQQFPWTADLILDFLYQRRDELRALGVIKIGLFGSYVRGEQRPDSDIDFLLTLDHWSWRGWMDVWNFLEDHLGSQVDLVPEKDLRPELQARVLPEVRYAAGF
ncbi:MAG: nucleotidyltransferase domain-containing protein [Anaerolineae bacterium]|nr:nucleotidyltransferase domain-containing protein [Anaerolineae bacterium]